MPRFADRTARIPGSATVEAGDRVKALARQGVDVVAFTLGEPDFPTPQHVQEAAVEALRAGHTKYVPGSGIPELREAIAEAERRDNGIPCSAGDVLVTPAKHAVFLALQAVVDHGTEVLLPDPGWVSYVPIIQWAGGKPVPVPLERPGFRMTAEAVRERITPKTRAIILNSPSNPTGGVNRPEDVKAIVEMAVDHDLWIVSDEIYQKILYGSPHVSPASLPGGWERTFTVNGLSKSFSMTGWRIGWLVAAGEGAKTVQRMQSQTITHPTSFVQYAALAAVKGSAATVEAMRKEFQARRDLMVSGLRELPGVTCDMPDGAFYAFPSFDASWGPDDRAVTERLLQDAKVAGTPGSAFGEGGRGHVRFSYAASQERIQEGLRRLAQLTAKAR